MENFCKLPIFLYEELINLLYPPNCLICGKHSNNYLCKRCEIRLDKDIVYKIDYYKDKYFSKHIYLFKYETYIRKLIIDYKFNEKSYLCEIFVKILLKNEKMYRFFKSYDIIIPVPIHKKRKALRGYNQSELIANKIAKKCNIKLYKKVLIKQKNTVAQSSLSKIERIENAKNVYKIINNEKIINKKIILFDDIFTTGSTANECAKILKENGAKDVIVITIAKD